MTKMSDLLPKLEEEILSKVPMTSLRAVRSTCRKWNTLSKERIVCKARKQFLGFMMMDSKVCSMKFDLRGIRNEGDLVYPTIKQIGKLDEIEVSKVFQCEGLLLCILKDNSRLFAWNPYLGQTRWIKPRNTFHRLDRYALGYDKNNNRNHKILRFLDDPPFNGNQFFGFEIYNFSSNSWRVLDVTPDWDITFYQRGASVKGNAYFFAKEKINRCTEVIVPGFVRVEKEEFLLCFDFTTESFGPRLPLPFHTQCWETVTLCCVRDEQLAVLFQGMAPCEILEIWMTTNIEPTGVSWSKFLAVDMRPLTGFQFQENAGSFFIDEENKAAVVFDLDGGIHKRPMNSRQQTAYIIGQDGYFKFVSLGEAPDLGKPDKMYNGYKYCLPLVCSSYAPSLVQL